MPTANIKNDLLTLRPELFASKWIFERVPYVFKTDSDAHIEWKHKLGTLLDVDPRDIIVVGSAACGASLNPAKNLKVFQQNSDVDVAVVSAHHFNIVWQWMRGLGAERYRFTQDAQNWIEEHRTRLLYWGVIATDRLLPLTPLAPRWVNALVQMAKTKPTEGRDINVRLYMDFKALRAYHVSGIKEMQQKLNGKD